MNYRWTIIPDIDDLERFTELSSRYDAAFEYNDFFEPRVYQSESEMKSRIDRYLSLDRDRSEDTLHGVFYDVAFTSADDVIREHSRSLAQMSLETASKLNCKGVVFHTGLLAGLNTDSYINAWLEGMDRYLRILSDRFPDVEIYIENTFETSPAHLVSLMERLTDCPRIKLCLDYAHAVLTPTPPEIWVEQMGPYVRHMHLNDNDLIADLHLAVGDGCIDFDRFRGLMDGSGIDTRILLEVTGYEKARASLEAVTRLVGA